IVLDDLHWADEPSLLLLHHLAGALGRSPILIVGTCRDLETRAPHPLARTLVELARTGAGQALRLGGLTEPDIARLIRTTRGAAPPDDFVAAIAGETGGNPFFISEIVRPRPSDDRIEGHAGSDWCLSLPPSVRAAIILRWGQTSGACREVLDAAAVIGRDFDLDLLEQAAGLTRDRVLELIEEAELTGLVVPAPGAAGRFRFVHALVREAIYEEQTSTRRARLHRRIGDALETQGPATSQARLAALAHHCFQAVPTGDTLDRAIAYAQQAGDGALKLLAYEEAADLYDRAERALDLLAAPDDRRRLDLLLALRRARARAGDAAGAQAAARRAAEVARGLGTADALAAAALGFEDNWATVGVVDRYAVGLLEEALDRLGPNDPARRARILARLALELYWSETPRRAVELGQEALDLARQVGDPAALAAALRSQHYTLQGPDSRERRLAIAGEMLALADRTGDPEMRARARWLRVGNSLEMGDLAAFDAEVLALAELAEELRHPHHRWNVAIARATRAHLMGRIDESESLARGALDLGRRIPNRFVEEAFAGQLYGVRREQGRLAELVPILRDAADRSPTLAIWHCGLAVTLALAGHTAEAARVVDRLAAGNFHGLREDSLWLPSLALLAEACAVLGDRPRAAALYDRVAPFASSHIALAASMYLGSTTRYLGLLAQTSGETARARAHFEDALASHAEMGARLWLIHAQIDLAHLLVGAGGPADLDRARLLFEEAREAARDLGLVELTGRASRGVAEVHERAGEGYPDGLTAREVEVLRLIAAGQTNKEIARELAVRVPTIDRHVANIYTKIGARGRAEAATYALRRGLVRPN
ncbi:MAG TPA: LuxR C-terminal-related transcriptional regulator, partial [Dehalococcoidia bacterium]|nr:LuxR C-terminal-related transcriptional regulator [Dehalococcoidia bacterium]